ncbi:hypothetical protein B9X95_06190 [Acinetobacter baumannii]|uniref:AAA+ ATPase domain-containing protein n=2 Tax=Acinetobacter baumannii TaxID=470 RepID=A0A241ZG20_ACIBA|nr:hypothetical protein B9X95_06190 [Acinetobacter baumannii]RSR86514.1 hypothetical protein EA664_16595 [Acinetobacter baumannii]
MTWRIIMTVSKKIKLLQMKNVKNENTQWLWKNWLPLGKLTLLAGPAGVGKTTLLMDIAATISNGGTLPFQSIYSNMCSVVIYSTEDDIETTLNPRLTACGANTSNIYYITGTLKKEDKLEYFDPTQDFKLIENCLIEDSNIKLIIIDPIVSVISGDMHKSNEVRKSLAIFVELAQKYNCAIVGITHFSKSNLPTASPVDKIIGSQAFTAFARMVWIILVINGKKILVRAKSNITRLKGALVYEIEDFIVDININTTRVKWTEYIESDYDELLKYDSKENAIEKDSTISRARLLILDYLSEEQVIESKKLEKFIIHTNKVSESTYRRAIKLLKNESKIESIKKKEWFWRLITE